MNEKRMLFVLLFILFAGGCVASKPTFNPGIVIEEFKPDITGDILSGERFDMLLRLRNTGSRRTDVYVEIYNTDGDNGISCVPKTCNQQFELLPPDRDAGISGEAKTCIWSCVAPDVGEGLTLTYTPAVRVFYSYSTDIVKNINIILKDEIRNVDLGKVSLPTEESVSTEGPIRLGVSTQGNLRRWEGLKSVTFPIEIRIENVGGGTVCMDDCRLVGELDKNKLILAFFGDAEIKDCELQEGQAVIELLNGKEAKLVCNVIIHVNPTEKIIQKTIEFEARYGYYIDSKTSIRIVG